MVKLKGRWPRTAREMGIPCWIAALLFFGILALITRYGGIPVVSLQRLISGKPAIEIGKVHLRLNEAYLCMVIKESGPYLYQDFDGAPDYEERKDFDYWVMFQKLIEPPPGKGQPIYWTLIKRNRNIRFYGIVEVMSEKVWGGVLVEGSKEFAERVVKDLDSQLRRQNARKMRKQEYRKIRKRLLIRLPDIDNKKDSGKPDKKVEPGTPRRKRWNKSEPDVSQAYPWNRMALLK